MDRRILWLCVLPALMLAMPAASQIDLGGLVDAAKRTKDLGDKDLEEEQELGEQMAATLLGAAPLSQREAEQAYVARVGHWVARHSSRPELEWRFAVLDDDTINAFAAPAGHVFITRGLLLQLHSEAELAGVLAHEIAHVTRKHHLDAIKKAAGMEVASGVLGLVRARRGESRTQRQVGDRVLGASRELYSRGLDRGDEFEADLWALTYMARAGYDPYAFAAVLQWLDSIAAGDSQVALLFTTHPSPADRLERVAGQLTGPYADLSGRDLIDRFIESLSDGTIVTDAPAAEDVESGQQVGSEAATAPEEKSASEVDDAAAQKSEPR